MKALNNTKAKRRLLSTLFMLSLIFTMSFSQGLLIEGAGKLIKSLKVTEIEEPTFVLISDKVPAQEAKGDSFRIKGIFSLFSEQNEAYEMDLRIDESDPAVTMSFTVREVNVSYENEMRTESWMSEPVSMNLESPINTEEWMNESLSDSFEAGCPVEAWMDESIAKNFEFDQPVEAWMNKSLADCIEPDIQLEAWMGDTFYNDIETVVEIEDWMTQPLSETNDKEEVIAESWMSVPLYNSLELVEIESWMLQALR